MSKINNLIKFNLIKTIIKCFLQIKVKIFIIRDTSLMNHYRIKEWMKIVINKIVFILWMVSIKIIGKVSVTK